MGHVPQFSRKATQFVPREIQMEQATQPGDVGRDALRGGEKEGLMRVTNIRERRGRGGMRVANTRERRGRVNWGRDEGH